MWWLYSKNYCKKMLWYSQSTDYIIDNPIHNTLCVLLMRVQINGNYMYITCNTCTYTTSIENTSHDISTVIGCSIQWTVSTVDASIH